MDITHMIIPGPAHAILTGVLGLPEESPLHEIVREIERLKEAAAAGTRSTKPKTRRHRDRLPSLPRPADAEDTDLA